MSDARILAVGDAALRVEGVLDFTTVGPLAVEGRRLLSGEGPLEIDLGAVVQANSAGLALLVEWLDLARRRKLTLCFRNLPDSLARLAALTNLTSLLSVVPGRA
jgi:phospholipid transport system transporter-binding protein